MGSYRPTTYIDFSIDKNRAAFEQALAQVRSEFGQHYPILIGGEAIELETTFSSVNPNNPQQVLGYLSEATVEHAQQALEVATDAFEQWKRVPVRERASYLQRAADLMLERRHYFSAWMVYEVGKSWAEADADTAEAVDFLNYYAEQMIRLDESADGMLVDYAPEHNELRYIPLGVGAVIAPWNFPNAILVGMSSAAIVAGNTVVSKPAEPSSIVGYKALELFREVGLPAGVLNVLTGPGRSIGAHIVSSPLTRFVAFTGSRDVGIRIYGETAKVHPGQKWLKRAILEMGGKDAVVVDETADLESAAQGIVASAFGYQGQKCSAGSRAIIVRDVYETVKDRVVELTSELTLGPVDDVENYMGAVINEEAFQKISEYIEIGKGEGELLHGGTVANDPETEGYLIAPTIFGNVSDQARIAQEEIFGPVLALIPAEDYDDAIRIANGTDYGLTGAIYSNDDERLARAKDDFHVGNLYLNRKCTGALVGVHPFGGFNMSGTDSKAGGPDYLLLFTQAKSIATKK
ncbi:MAG: L-glutamate gamma-semialdehyde dehydrogenase [Anaerolineales bacterium]|nr:L-glutamate gamma-semialdehyde dehydrogenase [Anaerolineales bacterium]